MNPLFFLSRKESETKVANDRFLNVGAIVSVIAILSVTQIFTNMKDIAHRALLSNSIDETELKTGKRTTQVKDILNYFAKNCYSPLNQKKRQRGVNLPAAVLRLDVNNIVIYDFCGSATIIIALEIM